MPPLALVVCPLPVERAAVRVLTAVLEELGNDAWVFCPEPYQAPPAWERAHRVLPLADLPMERQRGAIGAPVYLLDGGPGEVALRRCRARVPGAEVFAATAPTASDLRTASSAVNPQPGVKPLSDGPTVEAMVLAYRSKDYVAPCIESLLAQDWPNLKVTVLDNASGDGTADFVRQRYPDVQVIESAENLGFAGGHNLLFERCEADYVALLNHDAVARRNWVFEMVAAAQALPNGAVFGSKMLMRRCPTIINSTGISMNESGFAADRDIGRKDLDPPMAPERVFAVSGGALLVRRQVLSRIGGFDPTFFMYVEDVDLCWRARLAGHEVYYVSTAVAIHDWHGDLAAEGTGKVEEGEAVVAEREGRRRFMVERNRLQAVIKNYDRNNLRRVWRGLKQFDRGRLEALRNHIAQGGGALPRRVLEAVENARRWCRRHAPGLWLRRFHTQRLRAVPDTAFTDLVVEGFHEPSAVGDLHAIVDRYCTEGRREITMGNGDQGCLGPGWHHAEPRSEGGLRWSMAECWFYLRGENSWDSVTVEIVAPPLPGHAELWADGVAAGRVEFAQGEARGLHWQLPEPVPTGQIAECRIVCSAFVPMQEGMGQDARELGLHVRSIRGQ